MNKTRSILVLCISLLVLLSRQQSTNSMEYSTVGVIIDGTSRAGREAKVSIQLALDDISNKTKQRFVKHIINSEGEPFLAALAARELVDKHQVQVILGPHTWEEASLVVEAGNRARIPTLSLAASTPKWATAKWPYLVHASKSTQDTQMKAVAGIVQSWEWHRVTLLYEENFDSAADRVIPNLLEALREVGAEISHLVPLPHLLSLLSKELKRLKADQCRVFVVHTSMELAVHLFEKANEMKMMEKGYVWIITNTITDFVHSLNASTTSSMHGVIGVKTYFPENREKFLKFKRRFRRSFSDEYPEDENNEPGINALEAYDAMWVVAFGLDGKGTQVESKGQQFLERVSSIDFKGMNGRILYTERNLAPINVFGVVNMIGENLRELGFWSEGFFSKSAGNKAIYNSSMDDLGQVIWPGEPWYIPRGWTAPTSAKPLRVGVPAESIFKQYVNVSYDLLTRNYSCTGYAIEIFKVTMERLPYNVSYEFFPFYGSYDSLVESIYTKEFDAVVGDVSVLATRYKYAEFTLIYSDSALLMIVPVQFKLPHKALLFMKPFTKAMWVLILAITLYNGFVIWLIERSHTPRLKGSALDQTGHMISLSFNTLFSLDGGKLDNNLARLAMVVWLFVALVITQSYTASLTSMLTVQQVEPTVTDIETLKSNNALVGYATGTFIAKYLTDVLGFKPDNIKNFSSPLEYAQALKSGEITALFLNGGFVKLFLAKYCKSFMVAGPSYKVGGFGFGFPKGSPMLADINAALLSVFESGTLKKIEDSMIGSETCVEVDSSNDEDASISLSSFWILFAITGGTSTCALAIYALSRLRDKRRLLFSRRVSHAESAENHSAASNT